MGLYIGSDRVEIRQKVVNYSTKQELTNMRKILLLLLLPAQLLAQQPSFLAFKKYPFPTGLTASASGTRIAWALDEEGRRNIYVAEGPAYTPRKLTDFAKDDGQEISSLTLSADG